MRARRRMIILAALLFAVPLVHADQVSYTKPRIRAVTGFVRLDRAKYVEQIDETLAVLSSARAEFAKEGYEVETLRIVTQPLGELIGGLPDEAALSFLKSLDDLSVQKGFVPNVGPAMLRDSDDPHAIRLLAKALAVLPNLHANAIIAGEDGIHWKVIHETAALVRYVADHDQHGHGALDFTATAMLKPYAPFYPGAYHVGPGRNFSIGLEAANVVQEVFARTHGDFAASVSELTRQLTVHAKVAEAIGRRVSVASHWEFMGVDPTPAPRADVTIGKAFENYLGGAPFGSSGTMTAALIITTAVKAVPVQQVGYSGLMLPVMEDGDLSARWAQGTFGLTALLAYSAVCGTGLDTIPFPGDVSVEQMTRVFGDVASLAWKWNKPLSARLLPFKDAKPGDTTHLKGKTLSNTTLRAIQ